MPAKKISQQKSRYFDTAVKVITKTEQLLSSSRSKIVNAASEDSSPRSNTMRLLLDYEGFIEQVCCLLLSKCDLID